MRRSILFCLLTLGLVQASLAQRGIEELQKIVQFYQQAGRNLSFEVQYAYFEDQNPKPTDTLRIKFTQNGANYRMRGSGFEWLKIGEEVLWIDHELDEMVLQNARGKENSGQIKTVDPAQIAQWVQERALQIQTYKTGHNQATMRILNPDDPGFKIELNYDPSSHCLFKMNLEQSEIAEEGDAAESHIRISAQYRHYVLEKGDFPYLFKQYFIRSKNSVIPIKSYQNYRVETL